MIHDSVLRLCVGFVSVVLLLPDFAACVEAYTFFRLLVHLVSSKFIIRNNLI